jgi:hypothetical protein
LDGLIESELIIDDVEGCFSLIGHAFLLSSVVDVVSGEIPTGALGIVGAVPSWRCEDSDGVNVAGDPDEDKFIPAFQHCGPLGHDEVLMPLNGGHDDADGQPCLAKRSSRQRGPGLDEHPV